MTFLERLDRDAKKGTLSTTLHDILRDFFDSYCQAVVSNGYDTTKLEPLLLQFLDLVIQQSKHPYTFEPFHQRITEPFDFYRFGIEFIRPLIRMDQSSVRHLENVDNIAKQLANGDNVILFANHQTEPDPQAISLLLEKTHPKLAEEMIFVAGDRVISDPLAVPFSMGRNLLCIYSKKHLEYPLERKEEKLLHNQRTMKRMAQLLSEGSKCIYVAPSGGRDRPNADGKVEVALFDPQSIEMFFLMAKRSGRTTHYYPLALSTYNLLPPPDSVEKQLGEARYPQATPIHLSFAPEVDIGTEVDNKGDCTKQELKKKRAKYFWERVNKEYQELENL